LARLRSRFQPRRVPDGKNGGARGWTRSLPSTRRCVTAKASGLAGAETSPRTAIRSRPRRSSTTTSLTWWTDLGDDDYQNITTVLPTACCGRCLHYRFDLRRILPSRPVRLHAVNEHFASEIDKFLRPDDIVWVHDYHLMPLASCCATAVNRNRIGYFLHIPCPPPEILTALPNHERLLPTLGQYDLVGSRPATMHSISRAISRANAGCTAATSPTRSATAKCRSTPFRSVSKRAIRQDGAAGGQIELRAECRRQPDGRPQIIGRRSSRLYQGPQSAARLPMSSSCAPTRSGAAKVTYLQITPKSRSEIREYGERSGR